MSKHYTHNQCSVMHDIQFMSIEELEEQYDIEVYEDGAVWDNCESREFADLHEWALFIEDMQREDDVEEIVVKTGKHRYDDDF